jgi:hypothetical protein
MSWTTGTLADFMGDNVVYRNLEPMTSVIAGLRADWAAIGLDHYYVPRKTAPAYAVALMHYLQAAQRARGLPPLDRLLFLGDTLMLDGTAARNLGQHLPMRGFIGADRLKEAPAIDVQGDLMVANRWGALAEFLAWVARDRFAGGERTALLIDLDKTTLGPRGRNDKVIDRARVEAIKRTLSYALGGALPEADFLALYDALNVPAYHPFTADNQDYLAYVCLMVIGGAYPAGELWTGLKGDALTRIEQFAEECQARRAQMPAGLRAAHDEVWRGIQAEDPTPFKAFRRQEYLETTGRMNVLPDTASEADVLANEIVITAEVASVVRHMSGGGALVFGLSDKPDEASIPTPEDAARGRQPLHRTVMKVQGKTVISS